MDGYAVIAADTRSFETGTAATLEIVERIYTGHTPAQALTTGRCCRDRHGCTAPAGC
jgi:molybdopterin biosynthesis enzyme